MSKKDFAYFMQLEILKALKQTVNNANLLVQDFIEKNKDNLVLKDLSTITIKKQIRKDEKNEKDNYEKEEKTKTTINKEEKTIKIKNLVNKTSQEVDKTLSELKTEDLKNILKNNSEENDNGV